MANNGLLQLRKLQIRALRALIKGLPAERAIRVLIHESIRRHERDYRREEFEDLVRMGDAAALMEAVAFATKGHEFRCAACGEQIAGFRTKVALGVYHTLGLCQACQDTGPASKLAPHKRHREP